MPAYYYHDIVVGFLVLKKMTKITRVEAIDNRQSRINTLGILIY